MIGFNKLTLTLASNQKDKTNQNPSKSNPFFTLFLKNHIANFSITNN